MATATEAANRIERSLSALMADLRDLPGVAAKWEQWEELERVSFLLDWDHLMADYLTELEEYYRGGQMPPDQRARYRDALRGLKQLLPLIEQLELYRPPVSLEG